MWDEPLIAPDRLTVARLLRTMGYRTACFGKWHLGFSWPFVGKIPSGFDITVQAAALDWTRRLGGGPVDCGFDYYFGVNIPNQPPYAFLENDHVVGLPTTQYPTISGQQGHWAGPGVAGWDWSQVLPRITTNTVRWIQKTGATGSQPFFLYASLVGPHQPVAPTRQFQGSSRAGDYGDYVQELDWAVGEVLDALEVAGVATNTLVIFTSDNGPDEFAYPRLQQYQHASMGGLRGIKNDIWEGGHRVPFLARWPGNIRSGSTNQQPVCLIDFMRTVADIVGAQLPGNAAEDSVSFLPALLGTNSSGSAGRTMILESGCGQFGIRSNNWMYIDSSTGDGHNPELEPLWFKQERNYVSQSISPALLYDLSGDLAESKNLLSQHFAVANQLQLQLRHQRASSVWGGAGSGDWSASENWIPRGMPYGNDIVYSNAPGLANLSQTLSASLGINSLVLDKSLSADVRLDAANGCALTLANGINLRATNASLRIAAPLFLNQAQLWNIGRGDKLDVQGPLTIRGYELTICGRGNTFIANTVSGHGKLSLRSSGTTVLGSGNSFSGGVEVSGGGVLVARANGALGSGTLLIPNNSTLAIAPGVTLTNPAVIQGFGAEFAGWRAGALLVGRDGNGAYNGNLRISGDTGLQALSTNSILTIGGSIDGNANVGIMAGAGTVVFATNQFYSGETRLDGRLRLAGGDDRLPVNTRVALANSSSAELALDGNRQTIGMLGGGGEQGGNVALGGGALSIVSSGTSSYGGRITGTGTVEKSGPGTWILDGASTYAGATLVRAGRLVVNGSIGNTEVSVAGGALSGGGVVGGPVTVAAGGVLALTVASGGLTITNELVLGPGSSTQVELDSVEATSGRVLGLASVSYGGVLQISNVAPAGIFTNGQSFHLFSSLRGSGNFSTIQPVPGPGLAWRFDPAQGILSVVAPPALRVAALGKNSTAVFWTGRGFHLQVLTNSSGMNTAHGWFDYLGNGTNPVVVPIDVRQRNVFFRLVSP